MARVIWRQSALADLNDIVDYIERDDPAAADRVMAKLFSCGESLAIFPNRGRLADDGLREMVTVTPYILSYRVEADEVTIVELRHSRQEPRGRGST